MTTSVFTTPTIDNIYVDLDIVNNDINSHKRKKIQFNQTRTGSYLVNPQDYYMSIIRFNLETQNLPVFVPQITLGQVDKNLTIYSFTMQSGATIIQQFIQFIPQDLTINPASISQPLVKQDMGTSYYYVYSVQQLVLMLNTTLNNITQLLIPLNPQPFIDYEPSTALFNIFMPATTGAPQFDLYMNSALATLFSTFQLTYLGDNQPQGLDYKFVFNNVGKSNEVTINAISYIKNTQDASSLANINPVSSVVFLSRKIPVLPTLTPPSIPFHSLASSEDNTQGGNNYGNILTDFAVNIGLGNYYTPSIEYVPQPQYRRFDLFGSVPLYELDIGVYWKDRYSNLYQVFLNSGSGCNIKLLFERKI